MTIETDDCNRYVKPKGIQWNKGNSPLLKRASLNLFPGKYIVIQVAQTLGSCSMKIRKAVCTCFRIITVVLYIAALSNCILYKQMDKWDDSEMLLLQIFF